MKCREDNSTARCAYSNKDKILWKKASEELLKTLHNCKKIICPEYFIGLQKLELSCSTLPTVEHLNERLEEIGWKVCLTNDFMFAAEFSQLQKQKIFPICTRVRGEQNKARSLSPDLIHSVFGHLPLLFWKPYRNFIEAWSTTLNKARLTDANVQLHNLNNELIFLKEKELGTIEYIKSLEFEIKKKRQEVNKTASHFAHLDMLYVRSVEFGIIGTQSNPKIIGAAILSSQQEILNIFLRKVALKKFNRKCLFKNIEYIKDQKDFYVLNNISCYYKYLKSPLISTILC